MVEIAAVRRFAHVGHTIVPATMPWSASKNAVERGRNPSATGFDAATGVRAIASGPGTPTRQRTISVASMERRGRCIVILLAVGL